jgi:hypothetical protein
MNQAEKALLLALVRGKLGDYKADKSILVQRRNALSEAMKDGRIDPSSPLSKKRPTLERLDAEITSADEKIATLQRLINEASAG